MRGQGFLVGDQGVEIGDYDCRDGEPAFCGRGADRRGVGDAGRKAHTSEDSPEQRYSFSNKKTRQS